MTAWGEGGGDKQCMHLYLMRPVPIEEAVEVDEQRFHVRQLLVSMGRRAVGWRERRTRTTHAARRKVRAFALGRGTCTPLCGESGCDGHTRARRAARGVRLASTAVQRLKRYTSAAASFATYEEPARFGYVTVETEVKRGTSRHTSFRHFHARSCLAGHPTLRASP